MKKIFYIFMTAIILVGVTACSHEHEYSEATCTEPKTCTICGETEGEALGHTVDIGICSRCGEAVAKEDLLAIADLMSTALDNDDEINTYLEKGNNAYSFEDTVTYYKEAAAIYDNQIITLAKIANIVSKYSEFDPMKKDLADALAVEIITPMSSSREDWLDYFNSVIDFESYYWSFRSKWDSWNNGVVDKVREM